MEAGGIGINLTAASSLHSLGLNLPTRDANAAGAEQRN
jgi:hypothetical protein